MKNLLGKKLLTIKERTDKVHGTYKFYSHLGTPHRVRRVDTPKCPPLVLNQLIKLTSLLQGIRVNKSVLQVC